jgi:hypothetical protein
MRTKAYGREILDNLPQGVRVFDTLPALADWLRPYTNLP